MGESAEDAALDAAAGAAMTLCDTLAAIMSCRARFPATMAVPRRAAGAPGSHGSVYVPAAPVPLVLTTQLCARAPSASPLAPRAARVMRWRRARWQRAAGCA